MSKAAVKEVKLEPLVDHEQDNLRCELSNDELLELGKRQAQLLQDLKCIEDDAKSFQTETKNKVAVKEAEINKISEQIRNGYIFRFVQIERTTDYEFEKVTYKRLDTGEVYHERPLRADERQFALDTIEDAGFSQGENEEKGGE